jgi:K+-transporting ATPase ATPase A chain
LSWQGWLQGAALVLAVIVTARVLGPYLARVLSPEPVREDRAFLPIERLVYRVLGVDPSREQNDEGPAGKLVGRERERGRAAGGGRRPLDLDK